MIDMGRLTPQEVFQKLSEDIDEHPNQYVSSLDVFDQLFQLVDEAYVSDLKTKFFAEGVNHSGLPDQFIIDYMNWKWDQMIDDHIGEIVDISLQIYRDDDGEWIANFHFNEEYKI